MPRHPAAQHLLRMCIARARVFEKEHAHCNHKSISYGDYIMMVKGYEQRVSLHMHLTPTPTTSLKFLLRTKEGSHH